MARSNENRELEIEKRWLILARHDSEEFYRFYEKYYDQIYGFIYRSILDPHQAEDLTSDTFLKAQGGLWRFRWQGVTLGAWFFRIAENELKAYWKKTKQNRETGRNPELDPVATDPSPMDLVLLDEQQIIVRKLIQGLGDLDGKIFRLFYWGRLTTRETAVILGIPEGTVKTRLQRGRKRLEEELGSEYPELLEQQGRARKGENSPKTDCADDETGEGGSGDG